MTFFEHYNGLLEAYRNGTLTVEDYAAECERLDWFVHFSDMNLSTFGCETIYKIADEGNDDFKRVYNAAHAARYDNESFHGEDSINGPYTFPFPEAEGSTAEG